MSSWDQYIEFKKVCKISRNITLKLEKNGWFDIVVQDELAVHTKNPEFSSSEVYFDKFCSKLKQWVNADYDCSLLDVKIVFPLLNKLIEVGDRIAKIALKRDYPKKIKNFVHKTDIKYIEELNYLLDAQFVKDFNSGELNEIFSNFNLPLIKTMLKKLIQYENRNEKWQSIQVLNKIVNLAPILIDDYISVNFLDLNYVILFSLIKERILNKITVDNLSLLFERPNSKIKEFLLLCLENGDKYVRWNAAKILCKGNQKIIKYLKNEILKKEDNEKIIFLHNLLKSGYLVFIIDDYLRDFSEYLKPNLLIDLINITIENFITLLESGNYESSIINENSILPSLKRIVGISKGNIKKVFEENIVNLVGKKKFLLNFYLFSGGYLTYLNDSEKLTYFNAFSSKILEKFVNESDELNEQEVEILEKGLANLGPDSISLLLSLLRTSIMWEWKESLVKILIKIGVENRELIRKELFKLFSSLEYEELSDILYFNKLIAYVEKGDLIKLLDNPQVKLTEKLKLALNDYDSRNYRTAINLLIKMEEYGVDSLLEWLKNAYIEGFDKNILEFFKNLDKKVIKPLQRAIINTIKNKDLRGLFNLIHPDLIKSLSREVILEIFWTGDNLITTLVELLESITSFEFSYPIRLICEIVGPEAENLLLRVFIYGVINDDMYDEKYIEEYGSKIIRPLRIEIFNLIQDKRIFLDFLFALIKILLDNLGEKDLYDLLDDQDNMFINAINERFEDTESKFTENWYKIPFYIRIFERVDSPHVVKIYNRLNEELKKNIISSLESEIYDFGHSYRTKKYTGILSILNEKKVIIDYIDVLKEITSFPFFKELISILRKEDFVIPKGLTDLLNEFKILEEERVNLFSPEFRTRQDKYFLKELLFEYEAIFQYIIFSYYSLDLNSLLKQLTHFFEILLFLNDLLYYETENNFDFDFSVLSTRNYEYNKSRGYFNTPSLFFKKQSKLFQKLGIKPWGDIPRVAARWFQEKWDKYINTREDNLKNEFYYYIAKRDYFDKVLADISLKVIDEKMVIKVNRRIPPNLKEKLLKINKSQCEFRINEKYVIMGLGLKRSYVRETAYKFLLNFKPEYRIKSKEDFINLLSDKNKQELEEKFVEALKQINWKERIWAAEDFGFIKTKFKNKSYYQIISELDEKTQDDISEKITAYLFPRSNIEKLEFNQVKSITEALMVINSEKSIKLLNNCLRNVEYVDLRNAILEFLEKYQKPKEKKLTNLKKNCKYPDGVLPHIRDSVSVYNVQDFSHFGNITSLAVTSDNMYIISAASDNTIRIWEIKTGKLVRIIYGYPSGINTLLITPDGKFIVSWSIKNRIRIWDFNTGKLLRRIKFIEDEKVYPIILNDKKIIFLIFNKNKNLKIMEYDTEQIIAILKGNVKGVDSFCISLNRKYILTSSYSQEIQIWDFNKGNLLYEIDPDSNYGGTRPIILTDDEKYLITTHKNRKIKIIDIETQEIIRTLKGHEEFITSLILTIDNKYIISSSRDKFIKIWDFSSGNLVREITDDRFYDAKMKLSPDGSLIFFPHYFGFVVVDLDKLKIISEPKRRNYSTESSCFTISPNGKYMINNLNIWDIKTGDLLFKLTGHTDRVNSLAVSNDSRYLLSGSNDWSVKLWELSTGALIRTFTGHKFELTSVAFSHNCKYVISSSNDGKINVWDFQNGNLVKSFGKLSPTLNADKTWEKYQNSMYSIAISNDDQYITGGFSDGTIFIWEFDTGKLIYQLKTHNSTSEIEFSSDRKKIFHNSGTKTHIWDLKTGSLIKTIDSIEFKSLIVLPDGKELICGFSRQNTSIVLYDLENSLKLVEFKHLTRIPSSLTKHSTPVHYIPNSYSIIVLYEGDDVIIWNFKNYI